MLPLFMILILQSVVSLSLSNTAFQDEALYLYSGRQLFNHLLGGPPVTEPYGQYFAGLLYVHPLLIGALDAIGGIEAARMLSLVGMLVATTTVYLVAKHLFDRDCALLAASLFAVQGVVLYLGRFATFDAMCLSLVGVATVLAVRGDTTPSSRYGLLVGVVLGLAVATKFAALLFAPGVIAILVWQTWRTHGWRQAILRGGTTALLVAAAMIIPAVLDKDVMIGLTKTTTERVAIISMPRLDIARRAASLAGVLVALAAIGVLITPISDRKHFLVGFVLLGSTLLAPAYHVYKTEIVSLQKHVVFSMFFAAPLAGFAVVRFSRYISTRVVSRQWLVSLSVCLLVFSLGIGQAQSLFAEWPNSTQLVRVLLTQVRPSGRILAEESEVPRYYLQDIVAFWQWNQLYWFYYTDKQGKQLSGVEAYKAAIAEGYFDLVLLRYGPNVDVAHAIDGGLQDTTRYELIAKIPYNTAFGPGNYWIWRKRHPNAGFSGDSTAIF
jgi:hypothetical protein